MDDGDGDKNDDGVDDDDDGGADIDDGGGWYCLRSTVATCF